MFLISLEWY